MLGCSLDDVPDLLHEAGTAGPIQLLTDRPELGILLGRLSASAGPGVAAIIAPHDDAVIAVEHGYGEGNARPKDYIESFTRPIEQNQNQIAALKVVAPGRAI